MTTVKMPRLARLSAGLLELTSRRESPTPLALFRIGVGISLLWLLLPMLLTHVGHDVVVFAFVDRAFGGYRNLHGTWGADLLGGPTPVVITSLLWASAVSGLLMVLGLFGRAPVLVAAICTRIGLSQNMDVSGAGDALVGNALLLLLLGDVTATLSLDCWLRSKREADPLAAGKSGPRCCDRTLIASWPRQLAVVQLCIIYTSTGLQKLVSTAWSPFDGFSALYQILQSPHWAKYPALISETNGALALPLAVMTAVTIVWEVTFFLVLFRRGWRCAYVIVGIGVHAGILLLMEVGVFSVVSMAFYPVLFSPQTVAETLRMRDRLFRRRAEA